MTIHPYPSPNYNDRQLEPGVGPTFIIIHYTECDLDTSLFLLTDGAAKNPVSAHYVISESGDIFHLVDESKRAWHCGISSWRGLTDMNSHSIGIELVNDGKSPFDPRQIKSLTDLSLVVRHRYQIPPHHVLGHSDIAPGRKNDPGPHFPWKILAECGVI